MCKASKYLVELESLIRNIEKDYKTLSRKQSEYDSKLSDHYHKMESATFNACEGYYLSKQLQEILRKRRIIKDEFYRLNTLKQTLQLSLIDASVTKTKKSIKQSQLKASEWQQNWKNTYSLEEIIH